MPYRRRSQYLLGRFWMDMLGSGCMIQVESRMKVIDTKASISASTIQTSCVKFEP